MRSHPQVEVVASISDIMRPDSKALTDLQKRYDELETEHNEALNVIDDLEFELGDVIFTNALTNICQH